MFGGHLNIRSLISKSEQLEKLLVDSNLDYLCLTETWLQQNSPLGAYNVPGYNIFRKGRDQGRGGGVLIYVKETIKCNQIQLGGSNDLECIGLNVTLSPQMSFIIIGLYRSPSCNNMFYDNLREILKDCDPRK